MQKLEDLDLLNDFMFFKTLENEQVGEEFGRTLLEIIFGRKFGKLKIIPQKVYYGADPQKHGVRLDVYLEEEIDNETLLEEAIIADIEPESEKKEKYKQQLPKRVRFYHAKIDANSLEAGADYTNLKKVIVIMIMPFDPFGYDQIIYTIQNTCLEVPELPYDDGAKTMFLYTRGKKGNVSQSLRELLCYMEDSKEENATNEDLKKIHYIVTRIKQNQEVSREFMKWAEIQFMWQEEGFEKGHIEGHAEGRAAGHAEELVRLCREFGKSEEEILARLMKDLKFTEEQALQYME